MGALRWVKKDEQIFDKQFKGKSIWIFKKYKNIVQNLIEIGESLLDRKSKQKFA